MQPRRNETFTGIEIGVARAERQTVGFAHRGDAHDLDRHAQVAYHASDHYQLLVVLLAEHRHVRLHGIQQPHDHGGDTGEMHRPERPAQDLRQPRDLHPRAGLQPARIQFRRRRHEQHIQPLCLELRPILLQGTRIVLEILAGAELRGIDEDAGDRACAVARRFLYQAQMPRVYVAHGGHQRHAPPILVGTSGGGTHACYGVDDLHGHVPRAIRSSARARGRRRSSLPAHRRQAPRVRFRARPGSRGRT